MHLPTDAQAQGMGHNGPRTLKAQRGSAKAVRWLLVLVVSGACTLLSACSPGTPAESSGLPLPTTGSPGSVATAMPVQSESVWAQVRAALPPEVVVYRPAFVPERFSPPELLEALNDEHGLRYTIIYQAGDELLVFILNNGQGALGSAAPPDTREMVTVHDGVQGTLMISGGSPPLRISWQESGQSYQIKVYSGPMTRDELLRIAQSVTPVE